MRITSKILVMMGAAVLMFGLASCSVNDDIGDDNQPQAVRFSGGIANQALPDGAPTTKAAGTVWGNDAIGIFMVKNGDVSTVHAANKQYTTQGDGNFTAVAGNEIYFPLTGPAVDFIAYYPYDGGSTLTTPINVEIATEQTDANQPDFDLLWAKAYNSGSGYTKATPNVALAFEHKLSKIVMNCTAHASVTAPLTDMTIRIEGMKTKNTFDLSNGAMSGTADTPANIAPRMIDNGSKYDAIILPETYAANAVTVTFTLTNGEPYVWKVPAVTFGSGKEHVYTITLKKTGVEVTGTINPWTSGTGGSGTAE